MKRMKVSNEEWRRGNYEIIQSLKVAGKSCLRFMLQLFIREQSEHKQLFNQMNSEPFQNSRQRDFHSEPRLLINPKSPESIVEQLEQHLHYLFRQDWSSRKESQCACNQIGTKPKEIHQSSQTDKIYRKERQIFDLLGEQASQTLPLFQAPQPPRSVQTVNKGFTPARSSTMISQESREQNGQNLNISHTCYETLYRLVAEREQVCKAESEEQNKEGSPVEMSKRSFATYACDIFRELVVLNIMMHYLSQFKMEMPNPLPKLQQSVFRAFASITPRNQNCNKAQNTQNENYTSLSVYNQFNACRTIIANQLLINSLEGEAERIKLKNEHRSTQPLQDELIALKIKKSKLDLMAQLEEVPDMNQMVFKGNPRQALRRNGTPFVSSNFRGVCRNGSRFQLFLMVDGKNKLYRGGFRDALTAAKLYDRASIQLRGLGAKTNFNYTKGEVIEILKSKPVFDVYQRRKSRTQDEGV